MFKLYHKAGTVRHEVFRTAVNNDIVDRMFNNRTWALGKTREKITTAAHLMYVYGTERLNASECFFDVLLFLFVSKHIVPVGTFSRYAYIMWITFDIIIVTAYRCVNLVQIKNCSVIINEI